VIGAALTPVYVPVPDTAQVYVFPDSEHEGVVGAVVETLPYVTAQEGDATKSVNMRAARMPKRPLLRALSATSTPVLIP